MTVKNYPRMVKDVGGGHAVEGHQREKMMLRPRALIRHLIRTRKKGNQLSGS